MIAYLENEIDRTAQAYTPAPGLHRLNRTEYTNMVRDMLDLDIDASKYLPNDDSTYGFDNIAGALGLSSTLVEAYVTAAQKISRLAIGEPEQPTLVVYRAPEDTSQDYHVEGLPFGTRGGLLVPHVFPIRRRVHPHGDADLRRQHVAARVRLGGLREDRDPARRRAASAARLAGWWSWRRRQLRRWRLRREAAVAWRAAAGGAAQGRPTAGGTRGAAPAAAAAGSAGDRRRRAREQLSPAVTPLQAARQERPEARARAPAAPVAVADAAVHRAMRVRFTTTAGKHLVGATFLATNMAPLLDLDRHFMRSTIQTGPTPGYTFFPHVGTIRIEGPYNAKMAKDSPSRRKIFICTPATAAEETACARRIITNLATRAFRRPATAADVNVLLDFYKQGRGEGSFDDGDRVRAGASCWPRPSSSTGLRKSRQRPRPGRRIAISDIDLASRLSFFIWSTGPDDELLKLATANRLRTPAVLEQQVRRMLKDPKAEALGDQLCRAVAQPARSAEHRPAAAALSGLRRPAAPGDAPEVELLFDSIVREDRSIVDLLTADYTFVNERLARHYGIPNIYGSSFRRVTLPADARLPARAARQRRVPDHDREAGSHLTGHARQVDHDEHPGHESAGSAARRAGTAAAHRRCRRQREGTDDAEEDGGPSGAAGLRPVPPADGSARLLARELRRHRAVADAGRGTGDRCRPRRRSTTRRSTGPPICATGWSRGTRTSS